MDDVTFREALLSDFEAVMSLGVQYCGRDYMRAVYRDFIASADSGGVVAVVEDLVVGFVLYTLVDGGRAVMKRGARVHKDFRSRGIFPRMMAEVEKYAINLCPGLEFICEAHSEFEDHLLHKFLQAGYKPVYKRGVINMIFQHSKVQLKGHNSAQSPDVRELTQGDLDLIFASSDACRQVFSQDRLINFFVGYRPLRENSHFFVCERGSVFASLEERREFQLVDTSETGAGKMPESLREQAELTGLDLAHGNDGKEEGLKRSPELVSRVAMVTFLYIYPTAKTFAVFLDLYSKSNVPQCHLHAHLCKSLDTIRRRFPGQDGVLTVTFDLEVSRDDVTSALAEVGVDEGMPEQEFWQILYEKPRTAATGL